MSSASSPFRALNNYRILPGIVGWHVMAIAFFARAPYAMIPLGVMTAFTASTGSVAIGGLATAVVSISTAIASPLIGRAADLWGQRRVLLVLTPINAGALLALFFASLVPLTGPPLWAVCLLVGVTSIPVGSFTRSRWIFHSTSPNQIAAAFSYESMADEFVFVLGPALVGIAASAAAPSAPLLLAFILALVAVIPFALSAPSQRTASVAEGRETHKPLPSTDRPSILTVLVKVMPSVITLICVGTFFGAVQAGTTVRAENLGSPGQAGLVYAVMGIGSALTALLVVVLPEKFRLSLRFIVFGAGMAIFLALVAAQSHLPLTALMLGLTGLWVGPTLVTAFSLTEKLSPLGGISVAMTSMQSSVTIGVSLGAAIGGSLAAQEGESAAFLLAIAVSCMIVFVGLFLQLPRYRRRHSLI